MDTDFRTYIKNELQQRNITIYALAKTAGLRSRITLYNYLKGKNITETNLQKILKALENFRSA